MWHTVVCSPDYTRFRFAMFRFFIVAQRASEAPRRVGSALSEVIPYNLSVLLPVQDGIGIQFGKKTQPSKIIVYAEKRVFLIRVKTDLIKISIHTENGSILEK